MVAPRGAPRCLKRQPGFARAFFEGVSSSTRRSQGLGTGEGAAAAALLKRDVEHLRHRIVAGVKHGESSYRLTGLLREIERIQIYHGDVEGAIGTRLRLLLADDASYMPAGDSFGAPALGLPAGGVHFVGEEETAYRSSFGRYRAAMDSSCQWGLASRMAEDLGRRHAALLFAKIAVNRLQEAREFLSDVDSEVRECFLEMHKDRYRWLADLLIQSERLSPDRAAPLFSTMFTQLQEHGSAYRKRQGLTSSPWARIADALGINEMLYHLMHHNGSPVAG